ncbi:MAG: hypothetical protein K6G00_12760 [Treponema sp.]|nr:hypothetical protein [Treponema sp.]
MDSIQKLFSDIEKIKKHYRAEHNNNYDGQKICEQIKDLFTKTNRSMPTVAQSFANHWYDTYILNSADLQNEPSNDNMTRIAALQSIIDGEPENTDLLTDEDWKSLCETVNAEAEDIPIDTLNSLMSIFLEKKVF